MALQERACLLSFSTPQQLGVDTMLPHNCIYDIPLQSRDVTKQMDTFGPSPVFPSVGLSAGMTLPVFESSGYSSEALRDDPLQKIWEEKKEFLYELRNCVFSVNNRADQRKIYGGDMGCMEKIPDSKKDLYFKADSSMINLAEWIEKDPHPYFSGDYVWLPAGGSIKHIALAQNLYIISANSHSFDKIRIIPVEQNGKWEQNGAAMQVQCSPGERIFQIVTARKKKKGLIGVRHLYGFHLVRLKGTEEGNSVVTRKIMEVTNPSKLLIGLDVSSKNGDRACSLDSSGCVSIYDVSAGKCVMSGEIKDEDKCKGEPESKFIEFSKQPHLLYVTKKRKIHLIDTRERINASGGFDIYDVPNGCEILSVSCKSLLSDDVYFSSSHHSFTLDPRKGWVRRWNHGLDRMPLYFSVGLTEPRKELVVTGTVEMGGVTGLVNSWNESANGLLRSSCTAPSSMPSVMDTAIWANSKGLWLEPSINKRMAASLYGMTIVPNKSEKGCTLFTLNSVGDIFGTVLIPTDDGDCVGFKPHETPEALGEGLEIIKQWENEHLKHLTNTPCALRCSSLSDRSFLCRIMKQHLNSDAFARNQAFRWRRSFKHRKDRQRMEQNAPLDESKINYLPNYKDWLASEILPLWDSDILIQEARKHFTDSKNPKKRRRSQAFNVEDSSNDSD